MADERNVTEDGGVNPYRPSWPPSPRTQIILIAVGFFLLNIVLIIVLGFALYLGR